MSAQGRGRRAPCRLTCYNYRNRNEKAESTGSAETTCHVGGHLARVSCPGGHGSSKCQWSLVPCVQGIRKSCYYCDLHTKPIPACSPWPTPSLAMCRGTVPARCPIVWVGQAERPGHRVGSPPPGCPDTSSELVRHEQGQSGLMLHSSILHSSTLQRGRALRSTVTSSHCSFDYHRDEPCQLVQLTCPSTLGDFHAQHLHKFPNHSV